MADPEGNEFCVLEPRAVYRDTGPIAAVVVDCADPRAMARFWGEAMDWTLHEVTDDQRGAALRQGCRPVSGVPPHARREDRVGPRPSRPAARTPVTTRRRRWPGCGALGATDLDLGQGDVPWTCLADPEGNEFCVLTPG